MSERQHEPHCADRGEHACMCWCHFPPTPPASGDGLDASFWQPHDGSIVYVTRRSFTLNAPGRIKYHRPSRHTRHSYRTGCGIEIWSSGWEPGAWSPLIAVRRDVASRVARPCIICGAE